MNVIFYFSAVPLTDDNLLLQHVIQIVVIVVSFIVIGKLVQNDPVTGKLASTGRAAWSKIGGEKGTNAISKGVGKGIKERALSAEAHAANADINTRRGRATRAIGGFRKNRGNRQKNRESIRERMQEEAYYEGMADPNLTAAEQRAKRARAMGIGGEVAGQEAARLGRQAAGYGDAKERERITDELKHEALRLEAQFRPGPTQAADLRHELQNAILNDEPIQVRAIMKRISEVGSKEDVAGMGNDIRALAGTPALTQDRQNAIAEGIQDNFPDLKARDPTLAMLDLATGAQPLAGGRTPVSHEQLSTMAGSRLQELAANGSISTQMVAEAAARGMLKLDPGRLQNLEAGLSTQVGTPQTVEALRVAHEAAPIIAANAAGGGGGASDRRVKKNIIQIGTFNNIPLYRFQYVWGKTEYVGTMAQDIIDSHPNAVSVSKGGFYRVDYSQLGFEMTTYKEWRSKKS